MTSYNELEKAVRYNTHDQVLLTMDDGRKVSIIQNQSNGRGSASGVHGETCEVWVDGEPNPIPHLTFSKLIQYLSEV
tara:strand:- start:417 stop:647 length:231 start_codon:yes stop_codon:yes gene_type:complete